MMFSKKKIPSQAQGQAPCLQQEDEAARQSAASASRAPKRVATPRRRPASSRAVLARERFTVDGIEVEVSRKRVKNLTLRIKDGAGPVHVSAPVWADAASIKGFVLEKKQWITRKRQAMADVPPALAQEASAEDIAKWRAEVSASVPALIAKWEPVMGVRHEKVAYRNMTSRWGSCTPSTGRICINIQLANYPEECLEYVVVHELCHLLERGHGQRFKDLMTQFLPDWKERRARLRGKTG